MSIRSRPPGDKRWKGTDPRSSPGAGIGLATFAILDDAAELASLDAVHPSQGIGIALIEAICGRLGGRTRSSGQHQRQEYSRRHDPSRCHRPEHGRIQIGPPLGQSRRHNGLQRFCSTGSILGRNEDKICGGCHILERRLSWRTVASFMA